MTLRQHKSKWEVVGDAGRVYSTHGNRRDALVALEVQQAWNALANGWERLTDRQRDVLRPLLAAKGREVPP